MPVYITLATGKADSDTESMLVELLGKRIQIAHIRRPYQMRTEWINILKIKIKKTKRTFFAVKQKVNLCLDLVMVWKVRV